jgi:hypothetical protein
MFVTGTKAPVLAKIPERLVAVAACAVDLTGEPCNMVLTGVNAPLK